jgi:glycosyltransferase involved in cell wall biosynthesis
MRIALDATPLTLSSGGLHRYVSELSRSLAEEFPGDAFVLTSDQPFRMPPSSPPNLTRGEGPRSRLERRWWSWGVTREMLRESIDVFHGTNFEVPYLPVRPGVMTVHDLSPWRAPAWYSGDGRVRARTPRLIGLGLATMVITPTEAIRREAIETFRIPPNRAVAVPEAAAEHLAPVDAPPSTPYFLFLGTIELRKNISVAVEAWRAVRSRRPVELVLAGPCRAGFPAPVPEPGLRILGEVPEADLSRLYSGATAFLYPSLYEGFGLPVVEAMRCGAAVFASRTPAVAEVCGAAAVQLDPADVRGWAEAMSFALDHPEWLAQLRTQSLERAREFSWRRTARLTREVYGEAIRRFGA